MTPYESAQIVRLRTVKASEPHVLLIVSIELASIGYKHVLHVLTPLMQG